MRSANARPLLILFLALILRVPSYAQAEVPDPESDMETNRGVLVGFNLSNRGLGVNLNFFRGGDRQQLVYGVDIFSVRGANEASVQSAFGDQGKDYVYGKQNYLFVITPSIGLQRELIPKALGNFANVRVGAQLGPAIGLLNPYSVEIFEPIRNNTGGQAYYGYRVIVPYDPTEHSYDEIIGRAGLLSSKLNLRAQLGVSLRLHTLVDFSRNQRYIGGMQIGLNADYFPKEVPIMAELGGKVQNQRFFLAGNIGLVFGNRWQ